MCLMEEAAVGLLPSTVSVGSLDATGNSDFLSAAAADLVAASKGFADFPPSMKQSGFDGTFANR